MVLNIHVNPMTNLTKTMEEMIGDARQKSKCGSPTSCPPPTRRMCSGHLDEEWFTQAMQTSYEEGQSDLMRDIAKIFGEDDLGKDGKSWSLSDVEEAMQAVRKKTIEECIERVGSMNDGCGCCSSETDEENLRSLCSK